VAEPRSRDDEEIRTRYVGFIDGKTSNFLIAYVRARPYIDVVKSIPAMIAKGRMTKQGLRDLNHYGPRPVKDAAAGPEAAAVAETSAEAALSATPPAQAQVDTALAK
jgi:hypothetical protein